MVYTRSVTKRLVDIDDELLAEARTILGTNTMKDTVNQALAEIQRSELIRRHVTRLSTMDGMDLHDPEVMKGAWR